MYPAFYRRPPATSALLGGQVDYMCNTIPEVVQQIQTGSIKGYAVSTANRNPTLPNVPTAKEAGLSDFEFSAWYGLFAPKGTPKPVLDKLTDTIDRALDDEATRNASLTLAATSRQKQRGAGKHWAPL